MNQQKSLLTKLDASGKNERLFYLDPQVKVLELENELENERLRLGELRKKHYDLAGVPLEEVSQRNGDTPSQVPLARPLSMSPKPSKPALGRKPTLSQKPNIPSKPSVRATATTKIFQNKKMEQDLK